MKLPIQILSTLVGLCLPYAAAEEKTVKLPPIPWHMVNIYWYAKTEIINFETLSIDVDISADVPAEKYNLYIMPSFGSINGIAYYGGIQTSMSGWDAMKPEEQKMQPRKPGFIFSRWSDKPNLTLKDVRATAGSFIELAGYEGDFASGRRPFAWKAGKYTFKLQKLDTEMDNGKPFTWVGAFVHEHTTGKHIFVSALRFPGDKLVHSVDNSAFIEFYGGEPPDIATLPPLAVRFSKLCYNGAPADLDRVTLHFVRQSMERADKMTAPVSPNIMRVKASADGREVTCKLTNKIFADSVEPDRVLWQSKK